MSKSREWFQDESLTDEQLLARCNQEFRRGPVGLWSTYGDDLALFTGLTVAFAAGGLGVVYFWDMPDEKNELKTRFHWRSDRDFEVVLDPISHSNPHDRWGLIRFKIKVDSDSYRNRIVRIVEVDSPEPWGEKEAFWWATCPLGLLSLDTSFDNLPGEDV